VGEAADVRSKTNAKPEGSQQTPSAIPLQLEYVSAGDGKFRDWLRRYREEVAGEPPTDEWLEAYLKHIFTEQSKNRHIWWAMSEERKVGFVVAVVAPQSTDRKRMQGMVAEFYVYPEFRREGYGRRMANAVIEFLHAHGCPDVHTSVPAGNVRGVRFWQACSFQISRYLLVHRPGLKQEDEDEDDEEEL
jgi:GNAT superfamily N-acetyltransferase